VCSVVWRVWRAVWKVCVRVCVCAGVCVCVCAVCVCVCALLLHAAPALRQVGAAMRRQRVRRCRHRHRRIRRCHGIVAAARRRCCRHDAASRNLLMFYFIHLPRLIYPSDADAFTLPKYPPRLFMSVMIALMAARYDMAREHMRYKSGGGAAQRECRAARAFAILGRRVASAMMSARREMVMRYRQREDAPTRAASMLMLIFRRYAAQDAQRRADCHAGALLLLIRARGGAAVVLPCHVHFSAKESTMRDVFLPGFTAAGMVCR